MTDRDRQTDGLTDRDRQTDGLTDRQTDPIKAFTMRQTAWPDYWIHHLRLLQTFFCQLSEKDDQVTSSTLPTFSCVSQCQMDSEHRFP